MDRAMALSFGQLPVLEMLLKCLVHVTLWKLMRKLLGCVVETSPMELCGCSPIFLHVSCLN